MKIRIKNIETQAVIGTLESERNSEQTLFIDIGFTYAAKAATANDDLSMAIDYSKLTEHVVRIAKESRCFLIETLAERILGLLRSYPMILSGTVVVRKPAALEFAEYVSAEANF